MGSIGVSPDVGYAIPADQRPGLAHSSHVTQAGKGEA